MRYLTTNRRRLRGRLDLRLWRVHERVSGAKIQVAGAFDDEIRGEQ